MGEVIPVALRTNSGSRSSIPNSGTAPADIPEGPKTVGQDLHEARRHRGKTLADVSSALKISPDYLTAIEMGRFEDLPARVYAVGYVRSYATYLGLDAPNFVTRFKAEMDSAGVPDPAADFSPPHDREVQSEEKADAGRDAKPPLIRWPSLPENALQQAVGVLILVSAISYSVYHVVASAPRMALPDASVPPQLASEAGLDLEPVGQPSPVTEVPRQLPVRAAPSLHEVPLEPPTIDLSLAAAEELEPRSVQPPKSTELASLPPERPPLPVHKTLPPTASKERPVFQSEEVGVAQRISRDNEVGSIRATLPLGRHYGSFNKDSRITLRLHGATKIRVGDNRNNVLVDRPLGAGDTYRLPNIVGLKLSAPDAGAIEIILDDTTVGFAGKVGQPARQISLDPKALVHLQQGG